MPVYLRIGRPITTKDTKEHEEPRRKDVANSIQPLLPSWFLVRPSCPSGLQDCAKAENFYLAAAAAAGAGADFWKLYVPPNFLLNRSRRPAVSTNFCLPVKNGWQALQISTAMRAIVLRVVNVLPQAQ